MDNLDFDVLRRAHEWVSNGHKIFLITVARTWGSAPRPIGAQAVIREDGLILGSVSGGCIEDDLIRRIKAKEHFAKVQVLTYGVDRTEANRWGLPCGGKLDLILEEIIDPTWLTTVLNQLNKGERISRCLNIATGESTLHPCTLDEPFSYDEVNATKQFGPQWRLLLIGAGQLSEALVPIAHLLDFKVFICDPREEYQSSWAGQSVTFISGMPDDAIVDFKPDIRTAIVALTHDPKLDDMALLEALKSKAFYVGALGSRANNAKRRERLAYFELTPQEISRLHGPTGLYIGSRTPGEIAVSIAAELVSVRNGIRPIQRRAA